MNSPELEKYLDLEKKMLTAREAGDEETEDSLLDEMDGLWFELSSDDLVTLRERKLDT